MISLWTAYKTPALTSALGSLGGLSAVVSGYGSPVPSVVIYPISSSILALGIKSSSTGF